MPGRDRNSARSTCQSRRERVTHFPIIRGPSLKGALRQKLEEKLGRKDPKVLALFGPDTDKAHEFAGALTVGDARVILFPMRSVKGTFAWTTSRFVLERLERDLKDAGLSVTPPLAPVGPRHEDGVLVASGDNTAIAFAGQGANAGRHVVVEDYLLKEQALAIETILVPALVALGLATNDELTARLAVVPDDRFRDFVSFCTEVVTRVHLNDETKTVKPGQLWTEELLPAETILAATLTCAAERNPDGNKTSSQSLMSVLANGVTGRFQIGGNETVGYGVCRATFFPATIGASSPTRPTSSAG